MLSELPPSQSPASIPPAGRILAICTSQTKGHCKHPSPQGTLRADHGLEGDAHAGNWHRQLSLLALSDIEWMRTRCRVELRFGCFAENFVLDGIDFSTVHVGTRLALGRAAEIEITQIGKECHVGCAISRQVGTCIMPTRGLFARVLRSGEVFLRDPVIVHGAGWIPHDVAPRPLVEMPATGSALLHDDSCENIPMPNDAYYA
jgi:MOSC domain-containing protein YiiM